MVADLAGSQLPRSELLRNEGIRAAAVVPVLTESGAFGALAVFDTKPRTYTTDEIAALETLAGTVAQAVARTRAEDRVVHQALHDALTGLPNRTLLSDRLTHATVRAGNDVALLLLDVDAFKLINDTLGHEAGDVLLSALAPRLLDVVPSNPTVAARRRRVRRPARRRPARA